ncbi:hypothetical protein AF435_14740 [Listeria monocytogenes]|uniref:Uncharacterized protein n=1 Tax=Listeria monocytogenes TaxID=1639 RepID=A0AAN2WK34_LISMN|nr:hypothetical protein [Listeria monocytogenes]EAC3367811.1 hypothetical protein [Listeria monocytogenes]EAC7086957.1 hypothetical protein [Listeria monocytogenes]EAC8542066.1 hypothetical protein [Listeria monocytogenes]EAC8548068.1 hypothetical protein [Listeria monocytogenes]
MLKKIDCTYNDANYNAEFLIELLKSMEESTGIEKFSIGTINTVPNDQERFSVEKGLFSKEVFDFNSLVKDVHGIKIDFNEIINILKQCRTVWELSIAVVLSGSEFIPSLEDTEENINDSVLIEFNLIEGDLFTLFYRDSLDSNNFFKVLDDNKITIE